MRVRPAEIEMRLPRYFREDTNRDKEIRNQIVDKFLLDLKETNLPEEEVIEERINLETNMESVIRMIQKIERGRQGIVRALKATYYKKKEQKKNEKKKAGQQQPDLDVDDAEEQKKEQVTNIQKTIRGFLTRRKVDRIRKEEMEFLGMIKTPENLNDPSSLKFKAGRKREELRRLQKENEKEYKEQISQTKEELLATWEEPLKEKMLRDRHMWIAEVMERTEFNKIPDSAKDFYEKDKVKLPLTPEEEERLAKE